MQKYAKLISGTPVPTYIKVKSPALGSWILQILFLSVALMCMEWRRLGPHLHFLQSDSLYLMLLVRMVMIPVVIVLMPAQQYSSVFFYQLAVVFRVIFLCWFQPSLCDDDISDGKLACSLKHTNMEMEDAGVVNVAVWKSRLLKCHFLEIWEYLPKIISISIDFDS